MYLDWVYSHEDVPAEIKCTVNSYPEAQITWYWADMPVNDTVVMKKIALNQYQYTLHVSGIADLFFIQRVSFCRSFNVIQKV